ncbi:MAG: 2-succinyl-5-enolpyruvyl-6-hydroxy-3-cyclohexene-1-carboxylic-acid synthase [Bacteroidales bacterium]|nr:2-succinyl-5-enolpyruvyl-6-hydroxy-3-cyclohexene-1-carboxylic-acid synthase [Bacteroidales bacterium]
MNINNLNRRGISNIPYICKELGISDVVICPGSRNAPLIIAFSRQHGLNLYSIVDERSAGYFALGIGLYTNKPVAVVCTSGTAVLNLAPAVAEAYYQNVPLIIFTADRPAELIDQGDGQTIHQRNIFGPHVKWSTEIPVETLNDTDLWFSDRLISEAILKASENPKGPVHINVPLREPLYTPLPESVKPKIINSTSTQITLAEEEKITLINQWNNAQKKLIIAGGITYKNPKLNYWLETISQRDDTLIIAENLSNLSNSRFIFDPEKFLAALPIDELNQFQPDIVVSIGNSIVSKRLKSYLRGRKPKEHWVIGENYAYTDTFMSLTRNIKVPTELFFELIESNAKSSNSDYAQRFILLHEQVQQLMATAITELPFSDLTATYFILCQLKSGTLLHLSNSMPIRYSQLFPTRNDISYFSNRGTSGIDGCTSTSVGMAFVSKQPTVLITGDLAFLYDSNALWNKYVSPNLKIIVLNNQGGNIFQMIDTSPEIEPVITYFTTPQSVELKALTEAFGLDYYLAENYKDLTHIFTHFIESEKPAILEIKTDPNINVQTYKNFLKMIQL